MSLVVGSFVICWFPISISILIQAIHGNSSFNDLPLAVFLHALSLTLPYVNTAVDPIIYACRLKEVRHAIKNLFTCKLRRGDLI